MIDLFLPKKHLNDYTLLSLLAEIISNLIKHDRHSKESSNAGQIVLLMLVIFSMECEKKKSRNYFGLGLNLTIFLDGNCALGAFVEGITHGCDQASCHRLYGLVSIIL